MTPPLLEPVPAIRPSRRSPVVVFAAGLICLGFIAAIGQTLSLIDVPLRAFHASSVIESIAVQHANLQPARHEWPLMMAKAAEPGLRSESYAVVVAGVRETSFIELQVSSSSPEHTNGFATWLAGYFTQSLNESYTTRGIPQEPYTVRVRQIPEESPRVSSWPLYDGIYRVALPALLAVAGIPLLRGKV